MWKSAWPWLLPFSPCFAPFNICLGPQVQSPLKEVETTAALNKHGDNCHQICFVREVAELAQADFGVFVVRTLLKHPFVDAEVQWFWAGFTSKEGHVLYTIVYVCMLFVVLVVVIALTYLLQAVAKHRQDAARMFLVSLSSTWIQNSRAVGFGTDCPGGGCCDEQQWDAVSSLEHLQGIPSVPPVFTVVVTYDIMWWFVGDLWVICFRMFS